MSGTNTAEFDTVRQSIANIGMYHMLVCKIPLLARRTRPGGQARRATIGYLVYKLYADYSRCIIMYDLIEPLKGGSP